MKNNRMIITISIISVFILVGIGYIFLQKESVDKSSTQSDSALTVNQKPSVPTPAAEVATGTTIIFTDNGFEPREYTSKANIPVIVKNESKNRVQFSSDDHPSHRDETELNLSTLSSGQSATFTPTKVGTWGFHDHIQDQFTGTLTITD